MDRKAWWATVHGLAELDTTERLTLFFFTFPFRSSQSPEQNSLGHRVGFLELPVCTQYCIYANLSLPVHPTLSSPPWCPYICSLCLCLYLCFASKIICTVFLESMYMFLGSPHCGRRLLHLATQGYSYASAPSQLLSPHTRRERERRGIERERERENFSS